MPILRIQHAVPDFKSWKRACDADPMDRKGSGVGHFRVCRTVQDPNFVSVDLEFESVTDAEQMLSRLRQLWSGPGGAVMRDPEARILEVVEVRSP